MKAQVPATGILKVNDWGSSMAYRVVCSCHNDECTHTVDIEADDAVTVTIYTQTTTNFWSKTRWSHIWNLLTKGFVKYETSLIMSPQVALNYAETLKKAVSDVQNFKKS
jgi:hypothetical protein